MKSVVIDTNVILHDPNCIHSFKNKKIYIIVEVLEELDKFKGGSDQKARNARHFIRDIEFGNIKNLETVAGGYHDISFESRALREPTTDNLVLSAAEKFNATVITKDINLRIKAKSVSIPAEDYEQGKISDVDDLYNGYRTIESVDPKIINTLYDQGYVDNFIASPIPNEYYVIKQGNQSVLARYIDKDDRLTLVKPKTIKGISPKNVQQIFTVDALMDSDISLVALTGKAGTGKTLLALAAAIAQKKNYLQIYLGRPTVDMERSIGFLPGEISDKISPYMGPLFDNLKFIRESQGSDASKKQIDKLKEDGKIQIEALNFIRGRSIPRIFFIIDEAQNLTPHEIKTIITRAGEGTKIIFTGDIHQIDTPYLDTGSNGLSYLIDKMKGQELFAHVNLIKGERSELAELASNLL